MLFNVRLFQFMLLGLVICSPVLSPAQNGNSCQRLFSHSETEVVSQITDKDILNFIKRFSPLSSFFSQHELEKYFESHVESFKRFLLQHHEFGEDKKNAILAFYRTVLSKYREKNWLMRERESSLELQFKNWGIDLEGMKGYDYLQGLSQKNVVAAENRLGLKPLDQIPEDIRTLVIHLDLEFRHNTGASQIEGPVMLSSARMRDIGLINTTQSRTEFNREEVKSDDQLYFYVQPNAQVKKRDVGESISSRYGKNSMYLDADFAREFGWISPYIMERANLSNYQHSLKKMGIQVDGLSESQIINLLKWNIYTVSDFTKLYQTIIANYLAGHIQQKGYMTSPTRLYNALSKPQYYNGRDTSSDLSNIMSELGISGGLMELKVPAAIESHFVTVTQ